MGGIDHPGGENGSMFLGVAIAAFEALESPRLVVSGLTPAVSLQSW